MYWQKIEPYSMPCAKLICAYGEDSSDKPIIAVDEPVFDYWSSTGIALRSIDCSHITHYIDLILFKIFDMDDLIELSSDTIPKEPVLFYNKPTKEFMYGTILPDKINNKYTCKFDDYNYMDCTHYVNIGYPE